MDPLLELHYSSMIETKFKSLLALSTSIILKINYLKKELLIILQHFCIHTSLDFTKPHLINYSLHLVDIHSKK